MKTEAITLVKEDVLLLGQMVDKTVEELANILRGKPAKSMEVIDEREESINDACQSIEEKCLDLLLDKESLDAREIRTLISSILIATKFERLADHSNRISRMILWIKEGDVTIPMELADMADMVHCLVQDVLLSFLTDDEKKAEEIVRRDNEINYLHDLLSKELLSELGEQDEAVAQVKTQFLFCARFLERMGDACASIARRVYFIVTGNRLKKTSTRVA